MRDIKFRGWDKKNKRMIVHEQDFIPLKVTNLGVLRLNPYIKDNNWEFVEVDRFELMQYIGMKDINNVEIYEGDIVRCYGGEFCCGWQYDKTITINLDLETLQELYHTENCEVVGNIYENGDK